MPAAAPLTASRFVDGPSRWDGVCMSFAEFEALPEQKPYLEYFHGRVVQKPVPTRPHGLEQGLFIERLRIYARSSGGRAWSEASVYFYLPTETDHLVPDVAYWSSSKPQGDRDHSLPPTLAVEIRSVGQSLRRLQEKCRFMRANGVDVCWLVDPITKLAYVFEGVLNGETVPPGGALTSPFLPGFELTPADLCAELE